MTSLEQHKVDEEGEPVVPEPGLQAADIRRTLLQTVISILVVFTLAVVAGVHYREELTSMGQSFVDTLGGVGLLLCYFAMDAFLLPIPQDPFAALAISRS